MKFTRRQTLAIGASGLAGLATRANAESIDGVGPNRGVVKWGSRNKQTCLNDAVPISRTSTRISTPADFTGTGCNMIEDSYEGPFFTCTPAPGKDISYGEKGQPLTVALRLVDNNCNPLPGGIVDIWACNAEGYYSGYDYNPDERPPMFKAMLFGHIEPDRKERFCRGALRTDADGIAEFDTIYPGYYYGQPIHVHFKAHVNGKNLLTSQANFEESWNEKIMQTAPYNAERAIKRNTEPSGFPLFKVIERNNKLIAVLDLVVPT